MKNKPILDKNAKHFIIVGLVHFSWKNLIFQGTPEDTQIIFVDGGLNHWAKFQKKAPLYLKSSISIGDGDSALTKMQLQKTNQNLSDLAFFLQKGKAIAQKAQSFSFVGFLGGNPSATNRLDHLLFNISEISAFRKSLNPKNKILIKMDNEVFFFGPGIHEIEINSRFSFMSFDSNIVKITGDCEYKLLKKTIISPLSSKGLSNIGHGSVRIEAGHPFFLVMTS